jgi:hypothetical protein
MTSIETIGIVLILLILVWAWLVVSREYRG